MTITLDGKPHCTLNATCDSRLGTVAAVSGFLASHQCYITEMQQFDDLLCRQRTGELKMELTAVVFRYEALSARRGAASYVAGSRTSHRIASIPASTSGGSEVPQTARFSSRFASDVTPMMVLATRQLE